MSARLRVDKTLKMYVGGKFIRSESGRTMPIEHEGRTVNVPRGSRKDLRDAVRVARAAQPKWAGATAYNRGQILYRFAEMLEDRLDTLPTKEADAAAAIDRAVHHAGWSDKAVQLLSTLNPVAATYVNYSKIRPLGVVCAAPDPKDGLLGMVEAFCTSAVMSNATLLLVPAELGVLAAAFTEVLAVSDLPAGVLNVLTGDQDELLTLAAAHDDVDGLYLSGTAGTRVKEKLDVEGARVMRRLLQVPGATSPATPIEMVRLAEVQTVWMSAYEPKGGAAAY
ncbi:MAG: aldehyde dehydrogenase family protein [Myxococcales bacterium]|nr:aldehyde dehydrogenase family protein [Myxococcales bacterium]